jgi:hypothetical protein
MWWILFTAIDLYFGVLILDTLGASVAEEKRRRLALAKKFCLAVMGILAIAFVVVWLRKK